MLAPADVARWGRPSDAVALPERLRAVFGGARPRPPVPAVTLPPPALASATVDALRATGAAVATDDAARLAHAAGKSTVDLLRLRAGDASGAPDAVVAPASHADVVAVLAACAAHRVAVVPFGGGTSVVGGVSAAGGHVALDLSTMDRLVEVDPVSRTATFEPGVRAPRAEELLAPHGFTLGHFPQSFEYATIGGFAATRSSGQASAGYGRFDQMVVGLRVATPAGTVELGRAPMSAAGPDLRQVFLGSEGAFGVITAATVQVRPVPAARRYLGWRFADFAAGAEAVRALAQDGPPPTVLRLSDEAETAALAGLDGCLMVVGLEGTARDVAWRESGVAARLAAAGGAALGAEPGEAWARGRFAAPYLRDALLDAGVLVETMETAAFWRAVPAAYAAVRDALRARLGEHALVLCHVSHVYPSGASLYYTVAVAQADDPVAQWRAAKAAAADAIVSAGATISHHHGVGRDHLPWYGAEVGPVGVGVLRAVKGVLDPHGVLNPGALIPDA